MWRPGIHAPAVRAHLFKRLTVRRLGTVVRLGSVSPSPVALPVIEEHSLSRPAVADLSTSRIHPSRMAAPAEAGHPARTGSSPSLNSAMKSSIAGPKEPAPVCNVAGNGPWQISSSRNELAGQSLASVSPAVERPAICGSWPCKGPYLAALAAFNLLFRIGATEFPGESTAGPTGDLTAVPTVGPVPAELRERLRLDPFYHKHVDVRGLPILGSAHVSDAALREAAWIIAQMLSQRPDILDALAEAGARVVVMASTEYTTDVPEHAHLTPKLYWDRRARGLGGRVTSCGEENLLGFPGDPYAGENILIHELAHAIDSVAMRRLDPGFRDRLRSHYQHAVQAGLWKGTYAAANPAEYWAEGVQSWFDANRQNDAHHNHVNTREELEQYDPALAALIAEVFGSVPWRYRPFHQRSEAERMHLAGFDPAQVPRFRWREAPVGDSPRVRFEADPGHVEIELYAKQQPRIAHEFLRIVLEGAFRGGSIQSLEGPEHGPPWPDGWVAWELRPNPDAQPPALTPSDGSETSETLLDSSIADTDTGHGLLVALADDYPGKALRWVILLLIEHKPEGRPNRGQERWIPLGRVVRGREVLLKMAQTPETPPSPVPIRIQGAFRIE